MIAFFLLCFLAPAAPAGAQNPPDSDPRHDRALFRQAWDAAARGDHAALDRLSPQLEGYLLHPYLRYEQLRSRGADSDPGEMRRFLEQHEGWAFAGPLKAAWLRSLGRRGRWDRLLANAQPPLDTETRCHLARARIETGRTDGLESEVQALWAVGRSQPRACDFAFEWLRDRDGISQALAWERIRLAMRAGNHGLARYLGRFLPESDQKWLERWQDHHRGGYHRLARAMGWPDEPLPRMIAATSLLRLAASDPRRAMTVFSKLEPHFGWSDADRGEVHREIALQAAVDLLEEAPEFIRSVPPAHRDAQLLEWWARTAIARERWDELAEITALMPGPDRMDGRWRYWRAVALRSLGRTGEAEEGLRQLAREATFHGFLAADEMQLPYAICPIEPAVEAPRAGALRSRPEILRAMELREVGLDNWANAEWVRAVSRLAPDDLTVAAAVAIEADWHDRAIFALGNGGALRWYAWRFPLLWAEEVARESAAARLDPSWIFGIMRSESAMDADARSSAGALGLMQVTPGTARGIAARNGLAYRGPDQLLEAAENIRFGATFMREMMDRFGQNPVLVAAAYNAGPEAVERWLKTRPRGSAAAWAETIPYYETRDYIPRVLAFTAIYEWRLGLPVRRVSSRMPAIDSGNMGTPETVEVMCPASD